MKRWVSRREKRRRMGVSLHEIREAVGATHFAKARRVWLSLPRWQQASAVIDASIANALRASLDDQVRRWKKIMVAHQETRSP